MGRGSDWDVPTKNGKKRKYERPTDKEFGVPIDGWTDQQSEVKIIIAGTWLRNVLINKPATKITRRLIRYGNRMKCLLSRVCSISVSTPQFPIPSPLFA